MGKSDKLDFEEFLSCLIQISLKCYPSSKTKEEAMIQLLMDNILPLAERRHPINISIAILKQPSVENLLKYFEEPLMEIFIFYSKESEM